MQKKILVAVDDSTPSRQAVEYAGRMAGIIPELGVTLFHVQPPISQEIERGQGFKSFVVRAFDRP